MSEYASLFLLDSELEYPLDYWQGLHIEELTCEVDGTTATCRPFDPTEADLFRFKGSLRVHQWGKMTSLALTDMDLAVMSFCRRRMAATATGDVHSVLADG